MSKALAGADPTKVKEYHVYIIDADGHILQRCDLFCADDARQKNKPSNWWTVTTWNSGNLIARSRHSKTNNNAASAPSLAADKKGVLKESGPLTSTAGVTARLHMQPTKILGPVDALHCSTQKDRLLETDRRPARIPTASPALVLGSLGRSNENYYYCSYGFGSGLYARFRQGHSGSEAQGDDMFGGKYGQDPQRDAGNAL
jgi:hypothetical protein